MSGTEVKVVHIPYCDICKYEAPPLGKTVNQPAAYDGKTTRGPWAYMCEDHFAQVGVGLGLFRGQKLILDSN